MIIEKNRPAGVATPGPLTGPWLLLYRHIVTAREIDRIELEYVRRGLAFFHVSGAGHEGSAALAPHLEPHDWLHCHYRDKALLLMRGVPIREFFLSLFCKAASHSAGRQMSAHLSAPALNVLSIVGPIGNSALPAVGVAAELKRRNRAGLVLCSLGDGGTQQGEFLEAVAESVREELPVLFLIEDNEWAISTPTAGRTFFSRPDGPACEFYGLAIQAVDGRDPVAACQAFGRIVGEIRQSGRAALVRLQVSRLADHSNADDQTVYRAPAELDAAADNADPLVNLRRRLLEMGVAQEELQMIDEQCAAEVAASAEEALSSPDPAPIFSAKRPLPAVGAAPVDANGSDTGGPPLRMGEALRATLRQRMQIDDRVVLFGQDIEDPKGDVFGVTRGLSTEFPGRVRNSALSEATILGVSIGRALAGARPVAFVQFADFLPLAFNQIASEMASLYWRTDGGWESPVVVLVSCGGYRPGLGPFHSQTLESIAAHLPGIDVVMPATAADAAGLLNAAFASGRPTLYFYPKSCLNLSEYATANDVGSEVATLGTCRRVRAGGDLTFVSWGYPVMLCEKAARALSEAGIESEVLDLRSLSPWDEGAVLDAVQRSGRLIVVHEDNLTCGFGAEVLATVAERAERHVQCRRVARPDVWVPCHFPSQLEVLPSFRRIVAAAAEMLELELSWDDEEKPANDLVSVDAVGGGPADESVIVTEVCVRAGDAVSPGDVVALAESSKSIVEIAAGSPGIVREVLAGAGDVVPVGSPLIRIESATDDRRHTAVVAELCGRPRFNRRSPPAAPRPSATEAVFHQNGNATANGNGVRNGNGNGKPSLAAVADGKARPAAAPGKAGAVNGHAHSPRDGDASFSDIPISARQRILNQRMQHSVRTIPQATISHAVLRRDVADALACQNERFPGLAISEFELVAFCAAQATRSARRLRSMQLDDRTCREYEHLHLGIAVHLPEDDLGTAVIRGADRLSLGEFVGALREQVVQAQSGIDQASADVPLLITHFAGLNVQGGVPLVVSPATGVLFIGSFAPDCPGETIQLALSFDHRVLNGVAAARFLKAVAATLRELRDASPGSDAHVEQPQALRRGVAPASSAVPAAGTERVRRALESSVLTTFAFPEDSSVHPDQDLSEFGMDSLTAVELLFAAEQSLGRPLRTIPGIAKCRTINEFVGLIAPRSDNTAIAGATSSGYPDAQPNGIGTPP